MSVRSLPEIHVNDDSTVEIQHENAGIRLTQQDARFLLTKLLQLFDPSTDSLNLVLHRHGLQISNLANVLPDWKSEYKLPDSFGGFYVSRNENHQWLFGYPVDDAIYWVKTNLQNLCNLGIKLDDVKNIVANETYRVPFVGELRS